MLGEGPTPIWSGPDGRRATLHTIHTKYHADTVNTCGRALTRTAGATEQYMHASRTMSARGPQAGSITAGPHRSDMPSGLRESAGVPHCTQVLASACVARSAAGWKAGGGAIDGAGEPTDRGRGAPTTAARLGDLSGSCECW